MQNSVHFLCSFIVRILTKYNIGLTSPYLAIVPGNHEFQQRVCMLVLSNWFRFLLL